MIEIRLNPEILRILRMAMWTSAIALVGLYSVATFIYLGRLLRAYRRETAETEARPRYSVWVPLSPRSIDSHDYFAVNENAGDPTGQRSEVYSNSETIGLPPLEPPSELKGLEEHRRKMLSHNQAASRAALKHYLLDTATAVSVNFLVAILLNICLYFTGTFRVG